MPFIKGQSGNPGGRPKGMPFRTALDMELKAAGEEMPRCQHRLNIDPPNG